MPKDEWGKATARQKGRRELLQRVLEGPGGGSSAHAVDEANSASRTRRSGSRAGQISKRGKKQVRKRRDFYPACSLVELRRMLRSVPLDAKDKTPIPRAVCIERRGNDDVVVRPDLAILRTRSLHDLYIPITRAAGEYDKDGQFTTVPAWAWPATMEAFKSRGFEVKGSADRSVAVPRDCPSADVQSARSLRKLADRLERGNLSAAEAKLVARLLGEETSGA